MHRTAAKRFSSDAPGLPDAGFAASIRFQRRSVILIVRRSAQLARPGFVEPNGRLPPAHAPA
jgi:hypothetical protein